MEVLRLKDLIGKLQRKIAEANKTANASVIVGYTAAHAIFVHEMRPVTLGENVPRTGKRADSSKRRGYYWDPSGKAGPKFLEWPAKELGNDGTLFEIIYKAMKAGKTMASALLLAALRIQRESQLRVPVDSGNLKQSAFTRVESGEEGEVD